MPRTHLVFSAAAAVIAGLLVFWLVAFQGDSPPPLRDATQAPHPPAGRPPSPVLAARKSPPEAPRSPADFEKSFSAQVQDDAPAAAKFAVGLPPGPTRDQALRIVAQTWGRLDPSAALAWAKTLPDGAEQSAATGGICYGLASVDPAAAVHFAENHAPEGGFLENLALQWAEQDLDAALDWVKQRPGSPDRDRLIQHVAFVQARADPEAAAHLVLAQMPPGEEQTEAVISVVAQWARKDPAAAQSWVEVFPPGPLRERAMAEVKAAAAP